MRKLSLIFIILLSATALFAQNPNRVVKHFEGELNIGTLNGFASGAVELRYNFRSHWDIGARACIDGIAVAGGSNESYNIVADYNFLQSKKVSPFVGLGSGISVWHPDGMGYKKPNKEYFHIMPRVGIEFFNRMRITGYINVVPKYEQDVDLGFSVGIVFGGGRKK